MDDRHEHLIAAAGATVLWVRRQRASWTAPQTGVDWPRSFALAGDQITGVSGPAAEVVLPVAAPDAGVDPVSASPRHPAQVGRLLAKGWQLATRPLFLAFEYRRLALAAVFGVAAVWTVRAYGGPVAFAVKEAVTSVRLPGMGLRNGNTGSSAADVASIPVGVPAPGALGVLRVESDPAGLHVLVDGRDRGVTPLTLDDLPLGSHAVVLQGSGGLVRRTVKLTAGQPVELREAVYSGWLHVSSSIELQVSEGARAIPLDERNQALLGPGPHEVRFENRPLGFVLIRRVDIRPGATASITIDPPPSMLTVAANVPAQVFVDGVFAGETPLTDYAVTIGTRDITVRSDAGGERRFMTTVTTQPVHLDVDFAQP